MNDWNSLVTVTQKRVTAQGNETTYIDHHIRIEMDAKRQIVYLRNT